MYLNLNSVNLEAFFVAIVIIIGVILIAAIALMIIEACYEARTKGAEGAPKTVRIEQEDVSINVQGGKVSVYSAPVASAAAVAEAQPTVAAAPVAEVESDSEAPNSDEEGQNVVVIEDNDVIFKSAKGEKRTFLGELEKIPAENRAYYETLVAYILENQDCRKIQAPRAVTFKCKTDKMMYAVVKRGVVECRFMLVNTELHRFVREGGVKNIKINPVLVRLATAEDLELAKQTADLTVQSYREEQAYRNRKRKEARRNKAAK